MGALWACVFIKISRGNIRVEKFPNISDETCPTPYNGKKECDILLLFLVFIVACVAQMRGLIHFWGKMIWITIMITVFGRGTSYVGRVSIGCRNVLSLRFLFDCGLKFSCV